MTTVLRRLVAALAAALLAGLGLAVATSWSPTTVGLVTAATADDDGGGDDDDDGVDDQGDDDGGQVPAGGVQTGMGGAAQSDDDGGDDDDDHGGDDQGDDDGGPVPAGGVQTGMGGAAESWTGDPVGHRADDAGSGLTAVLLPAAMLAIGGVAVGRMVLTRLSRS